MSHTDLELLTNLLVEYHQSVLDARKHSLLRLDTCKQLANIAKDDLAVEINPL